MNYSEVVGLTGIEPVVFAMSRQRFTANL